jgi:hypothetical protein
MNSIYKQSPKSVLTTRNIILASIGWAVLALLFFLLFSARVPGADGIERRAEWYTAGTNVFEAVAYLWSAILCFRNFRSPQIVSGRNVWLFIGLGMLSYCIGGIIFGYYEIVLQQEPELSPADIFFVITYLCLSIGMILAVASRKLHLEKWQWGVVGIIGIVGSLLAWVVSAAPDDTESGKIFTSPASVTNVSNSAKVAINLPLLKAPDLVAPATLAQAQPKLPAKAEETLPDNLQSLADIVNLFYVVIDVILLIIATTLLLAFWGGRVAQSWRMIAAATFSLYIADMWFKYAQLIIKPKYESGGILEVFWVMSGVLFGMGAALEYDASLSRSRRASGRKRA